MVGALHIITRMRPFHPARVRTVRAHQCMQPVEPATFPRLLEQLRERGRVSKSKVKGQKAKEQLRERGEGFKVKSQRSKGKRTATRAGGGYILIPVAEEQKMLHAVKFRRKSSMYNFFCSDA